MAKATAHPDRRLISSEDVEGTEVYGAGDEVVGEIDHLLIEKVSGRVVYAVMSFGGFLDLAHSHYPIPWSALKYDTALGGYRTGITEGQLRDAPEFSDDSWTDRDWEARTHQHYGAPPTGEPSWQERSRVLNSSILPMHKTLMRLARKCRCPTGGLFRPASRPPVLGFSSRAASQFG